jgi:tetratricopeptide (TPR) repeat protein
MLRTPWKLWVGLRASLLLSKGRFDDVIELSQKLLQSHPDEPRLYYYLGRGHFGQKDHLGAYWALKNALHRARPDKPVPTALHYFLGVSAYYLGHQERCLEHLRRFRARLGRFERHFSPSVSLAKASFYMGYAYLKEGQLAEAAEMFEEVLRSGGIEDTTVVVDLATIYCSEPVLRYRDAVRILEDALARFPQEVELYKGLSYACSLLDENQRSMMYALKGLQLAAEDRWMHQQLAYLYAQKDVQNYGEAIRELDLLLREDPEDRWALDFKRHLAHSGRALSGPAHLRLVEKRD